MYRTQIIKNMDLPFQVGSKMNVNNKFCSHFKYPDDEFENNFFRIPNNLFFSPV